MKKKAPIIMFVLALAASPVFSHFWFATYKNEAYNYSIQVPNEWALSEMSLANKHIMYSCPDKLTEIKVKALKSGESDIDRIANKSKWNLRDIDSRLNKIIETGNITITKNIAGKLMVFEYTQGRRDILQRTLVAVNGGIVYLIECKAPVGTFYKYEEIFNTAFSSFGFLDGQKSEAKPKIESGEKTQPNADDARTRITPSKNGLSDLEYEW
ncbi:MAG: hypothetical protein EPN93_14805 [Spirochaetes bacterium]|nr:MAG: hypothetical protein EPN93_14805 [Spirochaetota bacterium]